MIADIIPPSMKILSEIEIDAWLVNENVSPQPYSQGTSAKHYRQFASPKRYSHVEAFSRIGLSQIQDAKSILIHITDWAHYTEAQMLTIAAIRHHHNVDKPLIESPGHLIELQSIETAVSIFSLSIAFGWSSYLYFPNDSFTILNWEGDLIDAWTHSKETITNLDKLISDFELQTSPNGG